MGIEDLKAPRRPARDLLIDALTAREAFQSPVAAGKAKLYRSQSVPWPVPGERQQQ